MTRPDPDETKARELVANWENDVYADSVELGDAIEEALRQARREGWNAALEHRAKHYRRIGVPSVAEHTLLDRIEDTNP